MKKQRYAYWISTALLSALYLSSATMYLAKSDFAHQAFAALGYPAYLVSILPFVKILGVIAILSRRSVFLSDLAYAGMFFHLLLALSAHLNAEDGGFAPALIGLIMLVVSFMTQNVARANTSPYPRVGLA